MASQNRPAALVTGASRGIGLIFMPIIVAYTSWAYSVMAGKVTAAYIRENEHSAY